MLDNNGLEALYFVGKERSFSLAAKKIGITQSAVSQRLRALEDEAGSPLVVRSSPPRLTAAGKKYFRFFEQINALEFDLKHIESRTLPPTLSLGCNHESFNLWFGHCIAEVARELGFLVNISLADHEQTIDLLKDCDVLGCVSSEPNAAQGCLVEPIGKIEYVCVATPDYIERFRIKRLTRTNLKSSPTVIFGAFDRIHDEYLEAVFGEPCRGQYISHTVPSINGLLEFLLRSSAYGVVPKTMIQSHLESGALVEILPKVKFNIPLYWHRVQAKIPLLDQISDQVLAAAKKHLATR
jgi:LysR family transcriptional regulator (chromosome initiation inhibitor)